MTLLTDEILTYRTEETDVALAREEARAEFQRRFVTKKQPAMMERRLDKGYEFTALAAGDDLPGIAYVSP